MEEAIENFVNNPEKIKRFFNIAIRNETTAKLFVEQVSNTFHNKRIKYQFKLEDYKENA